MYNFSIPMAIVDYIPVLFFGMTMIILQWALYNSMYKGAYALLAAGSINVFMAGFFKATWKLLYAAGVCDFYLMNTVFLPIQSLGFILLGAGLLGMVFFKKKQDERVAMCRVMTFFVACFAIFLAIAVIGALTHKTSGAPEQVRGTMVFIMMMVLGLGCLCTVLSRIAIKVKKPGLIVFFVLSFFLSLFMGYMSSKDSTSAAVNWIEQCTNCVSQFSLMFGTMMLHKNGLGKVGLKEDK